MCHVAKAASRFKRNRVVGMAGILDTARFSRVHRLGDGRLGEGRDRRWCSAATATRWCRSSRRRPSAACRSSSSSRAPRINELVERTRNGGGEIVNLLGTSAWYAPGAAAAQMVDAIMLDEKRVLPCTASSRASTASTASTWACRCKLGAGGIEEIVKLRLSDEEKQAFKASAAAVRDVVAVLER